MLLIKHVNIFNTPTTRSTGSVFVTKSFAVQKFFIKPSHQNPTLSAKKKNKSGFRSRFPSPVDRGSKRQKSGEQPRRATYDAVIYLRQRGRIWTDAIGGRFTCIHRDLFPRHLFTGLNASSRFDTVIKSLTGRLPSNTKRLTVPNPPTPPCFSSSQSTGTALFVGSLRRAPCTTTAALRLNHRLGTSAVSVTHR